MRYIIRSDKGYSDGNGGTFPNLEDAYVYDDDDKEVKFYKSCGVLTNAREMAELQAFLIQGDVIELDGVN